MPGLPIGPYEVRVNGAQAFHLRSRSAPSPGSPWCWTVAPEVPDQLEECTFPVAEGGGEPSVCLPSELPAEVPTVVVVDHGCGGCTSLPSYCEVEVRGSEVHLRASGRQCSCPTCGDCPSVCMPAPVDCHLPPLAPGEYTLLAGDRSVPVTVADGGGAGEPTCH